MALPNLTTSVDERTRQAQSRLGEVVLGKWTIARLLGVGGTAAVFEATHPNGQRVALKILHLDQAGGDRARERFLSEGYAANRVAHAGVVAVRDEGTTEDGAVFLVMDLLRGQTLAERLADGRAPLSVGEVLEIAAQLLDVLVHAHARGIIHRDIKPENVFLTSDGRVRLLDFSVARLQGTEPRGTDATAAYGTPAFMPPEQALGHFAELDGRSDLWSLGATMFLLLSGQPLREPASATEHLLAAMTLPPPSLGDVTGLPRSVVAVVDRALSFNREARFPDARSMQLAVRAVVAELSAPDSRAPLPPPSLEPMALSARPRPNTKRKPPRVNTLRPVTASVAPPPTSAPAAGGALPVFIALGFAVGIGIVVVARLTLQPLSHQAFAAPPEQAPSSLSPALAPSVPSSERSAIRVTQQASAAPVVSASASSAAPLSPGSTQGPAQRSDRPGPVSRQQ